jgi:AAA+ ATPase superfamily predicted ATPase
MTIIYGGSSTGKSKAALEIISEFKESSLYILTERDNRLIERLKAEKIDFKVSKECFLMDIKYSCLEKGGVIANSLDYCVVDCLNMTSDKKAYFEKIRYLMEVEKDFGLEIIATFNKLTSKKKGVADFLLKEALIDLASDAEKIILVNTESII